MRILHVLAQKPNFTGSGIYLRALLKESFAAGLNAAAVVGLNSGDDPKLKTAFPLFFESEQLPYPVVGMSDIMPYKASRWSELTDTQLLRYREAFTRTLTRAVDTFQPDVLHCHHFWLLTALTRKLFPQLRVVASCHGTGLRQQKKLPHFHEHLFPELAELDHGFCLTESQKKLLSFLGSNISTVGAGFDPSIFHPKARSLGNKFRMLFAGKIAQSKGLDELLRAVRPIVSREVHLSVAGSGHGDEAEQLKAHAQSIGVELLGRLSHTQLAEEMRNSDLFILPSYYEGLPLVIAEALSCGCRIVVTELPGVMSWLPSDLLSTDWIETVRLPRLESADQPLKEDLPEFVDRLRKAISKQIDSTPDRPSSLTPFLSENAWSGVFQKIAAHYGVEER